jgi:hypothetical protein
VIGAIVVARFDYTSVARRHYVIHHSTDDRFLMVVAVEARGLKGKKLETYAKVYLDKEKRFKTDRIKNSTDPSWDVEPRLLYVLPHSSQTTTTTNNHRPRERLREVDIDLCCWCGGSGN